MKISFKMVLVKQQQMLGGKGSLKHWWEGKSM
jgi:hypothetical protein